MKRPEIRGWHLLDVVLSPVLDKPVDLIVGLVFRIDNRIHRY